MKFAAATASVATLYAGSALAQSPIMPVTYNTLYDNASVSLSDVACTRIPEGYGYDTLGSLPGFPFIGGSFYVLEQDSPGCGSCWGLTYEGTTITVMAIDRAINGFILSEEAMNVLTNGQAASLGTVNATLVAPDSQCGL